MDLSWIMRTMLPDRECVGLTEFVSFGIFLRDESCSIHDAHFAEGLEIKSVQSKVSDLLAFQNGN